MRLANSWGRTFASIGEITKKQGGNDYEVAVPDLAKARGDRKLRQRLNRGKYICPKLQHYKSKSSRDNAESVFKLEKY